MSSNAPTGLSECGAWKGDIAIRGRFDHIGLGYEVGTFGKSWIGASLSTVPPCGRVEGNIVYYCWREISPEQANTARARYFSGSRSPFYRVSLCSRNSDDVQNSFSVVLIGKGPRHPSSLDRPIRYS